MKSRVNSTTCLAFVSKGEVELTSVGTYSATEGPQSTLHSPERSSERLSLMATEAVVTPDFSLKDPDSLQVALLIPSIFLYIRNSMRYIGFIKKTRVDIVVFS